MNTKQFLIYGVISLGTASLLFISSPGFRSFKSKTAVPIQPQIRNEEKKTLGHEQKARDNDGVQLIFASPQEALDYARRQSASPRKDILNELEGLVAQEKARYERTFNEYKGAIREYENLSSNFDGLIRDDGPYRARSAFDKEMQIQAEKILDLQQKANLAYTALMAKYDDVIATLVAKHF
ncbi:MAG TPA: hypothetical protein VEL47_01690 [Myxococcota bacterium]|nr:hypothetical protein [Myxococcota bacterium]